MYSKGFSNFYNHCKLSVYRGENVSGLNVERVIGNRRSDPPLFRGFENTENYNVTNNEKGEIQTHFARYLFSVSFISFNIHVFASYVFSIQSYRNKIFIYYTRNFCLYSEIGSFYAYQST